MLPERFLSKVSPEPMSGCWLWTAAIINTGYGVLTAKVDGKKTLVLAHRFAFEHERGPVPDGMELDHLCHLRMCVNPSHVEPKTHGGNMQNSLPALKTFCINGHERTPENTYCRKDRTTKQCKACNRIKNRRRRENPHGQSSAA